jgi:hypothetical protein
MYNPQLQIGAKRKTKRAFFLAFQNEMGVILGNECFLNDAQRAFGHRLSRLHYSFTPI